MNKNHLVTFKKHKGSEFGKNIDDSIRFKLEQIEIFGGVVLIDKIFLSELNKNFNCDEVFVDIDTMSMPQLVKFFLFVSKSKPTEFSEVGKNLLKIWWGRYEK